MFGLAAIIFLTFTAWIMTYRLKENREKYQILWNMMMAVILAIILY